MQALYTDSLLMLLKLWEMMLVGMEWVLLSFSAQCHAWKIGFFSNQSMLAVGETPAVTKADLRVS